MESIFIIITALLFLGIGYLLGRLHNDPEVVEKAVKQIRKINSQVKPGIIEYSSQADIDYHESGEELVDKERERIFREQFKP